MSTELGIKTVQIHSMSTESLHTIYIYYGATLYICDQQQKIERGVFAVFREKLIYINHFEGDLVHTHKTINDFIQSFYNDDQHHNPLHFEEIDCHGEHITPGFIDAHAHLGLYPEGFIGEPKDLNELTRSLTPQLNAFDGIWPGDVAFKKALQGGVTTVCILPGSANVIGGTGVVLKTHGIDVEQMALRTPACLKIAFGYNVKHNHGQKGRMPLTRMGITDLLRTAFDDALHYEEQKLLNPHQRVNRAHEHILLALQRKIPVRAHASRSDDILTAIRLSQEYGFRLVLEHAYEAVYVIPQLQSVHAQIVYGPAFRTCGHSEDLNFDFAHTQTLLQAGITVAHMTDHPIVPIQYLSLQAGLCVRAGVPTLKALELITSMAADILGCHTRIGRLQVGLDADFVRFNGPPLEVASRIIATYIQGHSVYINEA